MLAIKRGQPDAERALPCLPTLLRPRLLPRRAACHRLPLLAGTGIGAENLGCLCCCRTDTGLEGQRGAGPHCCGALADPRAVGGGGATSGGVAVAGAGGAAVRWGCCGLHTVGHVLAGGQVVGK